MTRRAVLWAEFLALFAGAPLAIALFLPPREMFTALFAFALVGLGLLWWTGNFDWRNLLRGWGRVSWTRSIAFGGLVAVTGFAIMRLSQPGFRPDLSPDRLGFLLVLWCLYPLLSALPQELIFRSLFFHRYGGLFPGAAQARLANAALFSLAHLMYWSWVVLALTFLGGLVFAHVYLRRGFPAVWVLHGISGNVLFTVGMGRYFFSGNVVQPF
ncbi:CPBP family glutamic-type intramembrane protease [Paracoccus sp. (in: a-proteobacteria)]|uniref:CPBP family glutamic-type intramembrane protease n=1 Tax=Paracoccus sp. TaxID=267 RepID=UPI0026DF7D89|nr:CPBP family glutamic-type intramembrane protease [Paracoccus sp. (in: a-proteobacteria)]MDO5371318.1 CPBP family glutamic-type intramembrane protease [Paracoccus sp. (in: a-proteobacteria)]